MDRAIFKSDGQRTSHDALNEGVFLEAGAALTETPLVNPFLPAGKRLQPESLSRSPEGEDQFTHEASPLTETTTEATTETTHLSTAYAGVRVGASKFA